MEPNLLKARIKSFFYSLGTLVVAALIGVFVSDDFAALVHQHVGDGLTGTLIMLSLTEVVKHVRNKVVLGKARRTYGASRAVDFVELI